MLVGCFRIPLVDLGESLGNKIEQAGSKVFADN